ncbi:MAG: sigma 54-interacting transcriptional regulator, partial [Actinobacteria bacterium]|nr:sigma 54-interacting transcriptional regulator [Actinomycetota bacterium]
FIHRASSRGKGPFIEINCGAIPESLLESELFGYEEGAFTGASPKMRGILELGRKLARVDSTVLILGESGVGKNMLAKFIHRASSRGKGPFIEINCGAIPESLLESELFGYEEGAFTGARKGGKPGLIELANSGTLFLNEISELPLALQVKLLQVIQERSLTRVGGVQRAEIDVRLIAATNRDLEEEVRRGKFREDLYYRLNVVPVSVPPLRDRRDDVPILVHHFLRKISDRLGLEKKISPEAMDYLTAYSWPGNIRELENTVERLVVTTDDQVIDVADLPEAMRGGTGGAAPVPRPRFAPLERAVEEVERDLLRRAYKEFGNTYKMAEVLGVSQATVVRKMQKYFGRRA